MHIINIKAIKIGLDTKETNYLKKLLKKYFTEIIEFLILTNDIEIKNNLINKNKNKSFFVDVLLINDTDMIKYNFKFRNEKKTTNVLSFQHLSNKELNSKINMQNIFLGDIVISIPKAQSEAKEENIDFYLHFMRLFIHGFLHLLGYDHNTKNQATKMYFLENKLLELYTKNNSSKFVEGLVQNYFINN